MATRGTSIVERALQVLQVVLMVFIIIYLLTFVTDQRERTDCQASVNTALLASIAAGRDAAVIEAGALDSLVSGLLRPQANTSELLTQFRDDRARAAGLRGDNPLPDPTCS